MTTRYVFDSCALLALAKGEGDRARAVGQAIHMAAQGDHEILVSTLIFAEVLTYDVLPFLNAPYVVMVPVDIPVIQTAAELRRIAREQKRNLRVPDAIHLATYIFGEAEALLTYDQQLLGLDGTVLAQKNLRVCKPCDLFNAGPLFGES